MPGARCASRVVDEGNDQQLTACVRSVNMHGSTAACCCGWETSATTSIEWRLVQGCDHPACIRSFVAVRE